MTMFPDVTGRVKQAVANILGGSPEWAPTPEQYAEWNARKTKYEEWWSWMDGSAFEELDRTRAGKDGKYPLKYPLKINPILPACLLHAYALFGEVPDTSDPMVKTMLEKTEGSDTETADETLAQVFYDNHMRDLDMDMGIQSQFFGGVVYKVSWDPDDTDLTLGIRIESIGISEFWCEAGSNPWDLQNAWIERDIDASTARQYGVEIGLSKSGKYLEHWSRSESHVTIDGKSAVHPKTKQPLGGSHDFGFVPFVYIPHHRAGDFWGFSLVPDMIGLAIEINSRKADQGDAIRKGVHRLPVGVNIKTGHPILETLPNGQPWINIGSSIGQRDAPQMSMLEGPDIPESSEKFTESLVSLSRIAGFTPSIAYGEEEGSQRSGQTLYSRMWPTLAHVRFERGFWTEGKNRLAEYILRILAKRNMGKITVEHLNRRKRQLWAPMVPVDRAALVDEIVQLEGVDLMWPEMALERLLNMPDIPAAIEKLKEWLKFKSEMSAAARPEPSFPNTGVQSTKPVAGPKNQKESAQ